MCLPTANSRERPAPKTGFGLQGRRADETSPYDKATNLREIESDGRTRTFVSDEGLVVQEVSRRPNGEAGDIRTSYDPAYDTSAPVRQIAEGDPGWVEYQQRLNDIDHKQATYQHQRQRLKQIGKASGNKQAEQPEYRERIATRAEESLEAPYGWDFEREKVENDKAWAASRVGASTAPGAARAALGTVALDANQRTDMARKTKGKRSLRIG